MNTLKWLTTISIFITMPAQMLRAGNYEYNVVCEPDNRCAEPASCQPAWCNSPPTVCCPPPSCSDCCTQSGCCFPPSSCSDCCPQSGCSWTPDYGCSSCCEPCFPSPCCPPPSKSSAVGYAVLGALLLGAGVAAGYAAGHNNKKQCCRQPSREVPCSREEKPCCPPKHDDCCCEKNEDICFLKDMCEELTFEICLNLDASQLACNSCGCCCSTDGITVTSFVSDPLGKVETGKIQTLDACQPCDGRCCNSCSNCTFEDHIKICNPFYGTYHFGVQIQFCHHSQANAIIITGNVTSSKTQSTTTVPISVLPNLCDVTLTQFTGDFSYAPDECLPSK